MDNTEDDESLKLMEELEEDEENLFFEENVNEVEELEIHSSNNIIKDDFDFPSYKFQKDQKYRKKQLQISNTSNEAIYVSIYLQNRLLRTSLTRITPVYFIEKKTIFYVSKPIPRSTQIRWLVFTRNVKNFPTEEIMTFTHFKVLPSFCLDFNDYAFITTLEDGSLGCLGKENYKKFSTTIPKKTKSASPSSSRAPGSTARSGSIPRLLSTKSILVSQKELEKIMELKSEDVATVREGNDLCDEESYFLLSREPIVKKGLENFLGENLDGKYIPKIAYCGSGGGCRAMVYTLGALVGAEKIGLLDCFTYTAGVSGSTWAIGVWESLGVTVAESKENIKDKFADNRMTRMTSTNFNQLKVSLSQKFVFDSFSVSLIDFYGAQLSAHLLRDTDPIGSHYKLSNLANKVRDGEYPLPIFTAIQRGIDNTYDWFEFTPFEVGSEKFASYVPSWSFGRGFSGGISSDLSPEPSFGLLLATFSSAFCAPLSRITEEFYEKLESEEKVSIVKQKLLSKKKSLQQFMTKNAMGNSKLITPAIFKNYMHAPEAEGSIHRSKYLQLVDAGVDGNLPFPPLLHKSRGVDIIIAVDASKANHIEIGNSLIAIDAFCKRENIPFPEIPDFKEAFSKICSVFTHPDSNVPVVIYLPIKKNENYSQFDPVENQKQRGYCSTFNFGMTPEQVDELSGLSSFNIEESKEIIADVIRRVIELKTPQIPKHELENSSNIYIVENIHDN